MTKAIAQTYETANGYRLQIVYAILAVCAVLTVAYAINVYKVVSKTVALQKVQAETATLTSDTEKLDSQYLDLSRTITPDNLKKYGLEEGQVSAYISRTASLGSVAVRGHEL